MLGTIYYTASGPHRIKAFSEGRCDPANVSENVKHLIPGGRVSCPGQPGRPTPNPHPDGCAWQKKPCGARSSHPMSSRTAIPCMLIRGGTSKGAYFLASDLPSSREERDALLLSIMGSPHPDQIDGIGGGHPLRSKVAIVAKSTEPGVDVDFLFAQVVVDKPLVDTSPNCGNILSGVGPFAIERGLVKAREGSTTVR